MSEYIPGTCNIGAGEIRRRQLVALIGFILLVVSAYGLISQKAPHSARLGLFAPAMIFAVGWIQSRRKFCLAFGLMGTFNFGKMGQLSRVADKDQRAADRQTALSILGQSVVLALAITGLIYFIPA
jgi:hypothetical protein